MSAVFIGDSITKGARTSPQTVTEAETFVQLIGASRNISVVNKGVPSDTSTGMLARFATDVEAFQPSWVGIMTGTNDAYPPTLVPVATFKANVRSMIERSLGIGAKVGLFTPPVNLYADSLPLMQGYVDTIRELGAIYVNTVTVDVHGAFAELKAYNPTSFAAMYMDDWHPTAAGHAFVSQVLGYQENAAAFREPRSPSAGWTMVAGPVSHDGQSGGWNGYTIRQRIDASVVNAGGTRVRVTFKAGTTEGLDIGEAWIGKASGYGFASAPVRLTFGGVNAVSIPANGEAAGEADFTFASTDSLVVSVFVPSTTDTGARRLSIAGWQSYYKIASDAQNTTPTGYTTSNNAVDFVSKVEAQ